MKEKKKMGKGARAALIIVAVILVIALAAGGYIMKNTTQKLDIDPVGTYTADSGEKIEITSDKTGVITLSTDLKDFDGKTYEFNKFNMGYLFSGKSGSAISKLVSEDSSEEGSYDFYIFTAGSDDSDDSNTIVIYKQGDKIGFYLCIDGATEATTFIKD